MEEVIIHIHITTLTVTPILIHITGMVGVAIMAEVATTVEVPCIIHITMMFPAVAILNMLKEQQGEVIQNQLQEILTGNAIIHKMEKQLKVPGQELPPLKNVIIPKVRMNITAVQEIRPIQGLVLVVHRIGALLLQVPTGWFQAIQVQHVQEPLVKPTTPDHPIKQIPGAVAVVHITGLQIVTADQDQIVILVIKEAAITLPEAILLHPEVIPVLGAPEDQDQVVFLPVAGPHQVVLDEVVAPHQEVEVTREDFTAVQLVS